MEENKKYIYESPDKGETVYRREFGKTEKVKIPEQLDLFEKSEHVSY